MEEVQDQEDAGYPKPASTNEVEKVGFRVWSIRGRGDADETNDVQELEHQTQRPYFNEQSKKISEYSEYQPLRRV